MKPDKPTSKERLEHVLKAIDRINTYTKGHTEKSFLNNDRDLNASMYQFTIIGEAIVNVEPEILAKYAYPWHKVRSFRNFILHEYHAIEMKVIWDTAIKMLPDFEILIGTILKNEF